MSGKKERDDDKDLDWRDYVAISIAALQTTLLPFVVLILALVALWLIFAR